MVRSLDNSQSQREQTEIPDKTFPINMFHLQDSLYNMIPLHWHEHLEWIAVNKGAYRVIVDSDYRDLHAGEVVFINSKQLHSAYPIREGSELYAIVYNDALLRNNALDSTESKYVLPLLHSQIQLPVFYHTAQSITRDIHASLTKMYLSYRERKPGYELIVKSSLLASLGLAFQSVQSSTPASQKRRRESVIQPLLIHLSEGFRGPITVEQAAQLCCVSPNYFCYIFKKATGKTLIEYVNMLRVHEAEHLFRSHHYSVQQVANFVGFTNLTYFGRVFKKFKNVTPSEYVKLLGDG